MSLRAGPALVGRRFLSVTGSLGSLGSNKPKLKNFYDWDWKAGWIRSSTSGDPADPELQVCVLCDVGNTYSTVQYSTVLYWYVCDVM